MSRTADIAIIGAGIAGASLAARLSGHARVLLLDMEERPGYHSTSRSAAVYEPTFGPPAIRALTRASGHFFHNPPDGFSEVPLVSPRGGLMCVESGDEAKVPEALGLGYGEIPRREAMRLAPLLRDENIDCFLFDEQSKDIDVDALHRGFLRAARSTELVCGCEVRRANRHDGHWQLETTSGNFDCAIVVNAAGAWGDRLASLFGASPLGLTPKRRSACMVAAPEGVDIRQWPQIFPAREDFYCKPSGGQMMISPGDAIAVEPHDAFADDLALAEGIAAYERVVSHSVWRIESSWGGLRTFTRDGAPYVGYDREIPGFFWLVGQGGYGIQTSPALSELAASMILKSSLPLWISDQGLDLQQLEPRQFHDPMREM